MVAKRREERETSSGQERGGDEGREKDILSVLERSIYSSSLFSSTSPSLPRRFVVSLSA